ncbi:ATP-binding cassette domain-containing protein [Rhodobacteraceae bacterium 2CG4]|uniref:ATP-binding cassette domain-containing protein n=1 Tax=Halovulum marinum TaxID=2662447 RepID=A0A6L5YY35_9RHOB|nr:ATP-binding cassette domain-containing protein [Halovulum marinum]MSU88909.1 ATP-binding cassette domain-containing protein [Halovulum marinum]
MHADEPFCGAPLLRRGLTPVPLAEARDLTLRADGQALLDGVSCSFAAGRRTVVMGANGSGKSLLLRLMHGLIRPTSGTVLWRGAPLDRRARARQALVFQTPVMLRRSVLANLRFALAVRGVPRCARRARAEAALEQARLTALAHRPARVLSGGEQQRLAIARALACRPELLLLDEPTASLDPASTALIEQAVDAAHADGVTVALVTHDAGQARRLADDIVFLHAGRVAEHGPAAQVLSRPRSEAARAWLEGRLHLGP